VYSMSQTHTYANTQPQTQHHWHTDTRRVEVIFAYMYTWFGLLDSYKGTQYVCLSVCACVCVWNAGCTLPLANKGPSYPSNSVNLPDPWIPLAVGKFNYLPLISSFVFCSPLLHSYLLYSILNCYIYIANLHTRVHRQCNCTHRI